MCAGEGHHLNHRVHEAHVLRDTDTISYRQTPAYARAVTAAAIQKARIRHHVHELWVQNVGQATSGLLRCYGFYRTS